MLRAKPASQLFRDTGRWCHCAADSNPQRKETDDMNPTIELSTPSKQQVRSLIVAHKNELRAFGVRRLGLFGSFVRGEQREGSDIDVLAEFEEKRKTFDHFMALCFFLEELFKRKVDVLTRESLSPHIGPHILREVEYVALDD
jgi:hypothetical protein